MTAIARWLAGLGAQHDIVRHLEPYGSDWARAWAELPRGDWMLGLAARLVDDPPALVRAAAACARVAQRYAPSPEARRGIEGAEAWATHGGPPGPLSSEAERLEAMAEGAQSLKERATLLAAAAALRTPNDPESAVAAASHSVEAALDARPGDDPMKVVSEVQIECADAVRIHLPPQLLSSPFGRS